MKTSIFCICMCILFYSCSKHKTPEKEGATFTGRITTADGVGVPGVFVYTCEKKDFIIILEDTIDYSQTDIHGYYSVKGGESVRETTIGIGFLRFFDRPNAIATKLTPQISHTPTSLDDVFVNNYIIANKGYVNISLQEFFPEDPDDFFLTYIDFDSNYLNPTWDLAFFSYDFTTNQADRWYAISGQSSSDFTIPVPIGTQLRVNTIKRKNGTTESTLQNTFVLGDEEVNLEYVY